MAAAPFTSCSLRRIIPLVALAAAVARAEPVCGAARAGRGAGGLALLQARAGFRGPAPRQVFVNATLEVDTARDEPKAPTQTGAAVAFRVAGAWTAERVLCRGAMLGEAVVQSFDLMGWPTELRISALGDDSWGYSKITLRWDKFVITIFDSSLGNGTSGNGSVHWVESKKNAPVVNTYPVSAIPAQQGEASQPASANATIEAAPEVKNCTTRYDPRASAIGYTTAPAGSPCVFGMDERDEGSHCILDEGAYGSFGWCYTSSDGDSFGSCGDECPLFGPLKVLGEEIDELRAELRHSNAEPAGHNRSNVSGHGRDARGNSSKSGHHRSAQHSRG